MTLRLSLMVALLLVSCKPRVSTSGVRSADAKPIPKECESIRQVYSSLAARDAKNATGVAKNDLQGNESSGSSNSTRSAIEEYKKREAEAAALKKLEENESARNSKEYAYALVQCKRFHLRVAEYENLLKAKYKNAADIENARADVGAAFYFADGALEKLNPTPTAVKTYPSYYRDIESSSAKTTQPVQQETRRGQGASCTSHSQCLSGYCCRQDQNVNKGGVRYECCPSNFSNEK